MPPCKGSSPVLTRAAESVSGGRPASSSELCNGLLRQRCWCHADDRAKTRKRSSPSRPTVGDYFQSYAWRAERTTVPRIKNSSIERPDLSAAANHRGCFPLPDQVSDGSWGF